MENSNRPNESVELINKALLSLYESRLPEINEQIEDCIEQCGWSIEKVSAPFFMQIDEAYLQAPVKILFVGRETYGWGEYDGLHKASDLMSSYKKSYEVGEHHNSPFWWFRKAFSQEMGIGENFMKATLWTNLSKIDVAKAKPSGKQFGHLSQVFMSLLVAEIAIVKPDIVLIMTTDGHYIWHINNYNWSDNEPFSANKKPKSLTRQSISGKFDQLKTQEGLPKHTYQITHPNSLRW